MTALERRYRRLLSVYPAAYRADREDEMLGTLMDAAPSGRAWPTPRETWALLLGGLRVHSAQNRRLPTWSNWRLAGLLAIALVLAVAAAPPASPSDSDVTGQQTPSSWGGTVAWSSLAITALPAIVAVLAWFATRPVVIGAAAVAAAAAAASSTRVGWFDAALLALLAGLSLGRQRMPRPWLWLFGLVLAHSLLMTYAAAVTTSMVFWAGLPALVVAALIWIAVDARPAAAVTLMLIALLAVQAVGDAVDSRSVGWSVDVPLLAIIAVLGVPALRRLRGPAPS